MRPDGEEKEAFIVKMSKEGYETVEASILSQASGGGGAAMAGNILLGGLIGAAVDAGTGAMNELKPNPLHVELVKIQDITPAAGGITAITTRRYVAPRPPEPRQALETESRHSGLRKVREPRVTPLLVPQ